MSDPRTLHVKRLHMAHATAERFRAEGVYSSTPDFTDWRETTIQSLGVLFGPNHPYTERFQGLRFADKNPSLDDRLWGSENQNTFDEDFQRAEKVLRAALEELPIASAQPQKESEMLVTGQRPGGDGRWHDVAQVCLSGHLINDRTKSSPSTTKRFVASAASPRSPPVRNVIRQFVDTSIFRVSSLSGLVLWRTSALIVARRFPGPWTNLRPQKLTRMRLKVCRQRKGRPSRRALMI